MLLGVAVFILFMSPPADAGMYKWTDENGSIRYTDDPSAIPARHKDAAVELKPESITPSTVREKSGGEQTPSLYLARGKGAGENNSSGSVTAPVKARGLGFTVETLINEKARATLIIDTGSSYTVISPETAAKLGYTNLESLPKRKVSTAGGVSWVYLVDFDSVEVNGAVAERVKGAISTKLPPKVDGLLGISFLKNFAYQIDSARMTLALSR